MKCFRRFVFSLIGIFFLISAPFSAVFSAPRPVPPPRLCLTDFVRQVLKPLNPKLSKYTDLYDRLQTELPASSRRLAELCRRLDRLRVRIAAQASNPELLQLVQRVMTRRLRTDGYLPGGSVDWTVQRVDDLIRDAMTHPRGSTMLSNAVDNLRTAEGLRALLLRRLNATEPPALPDLLELYESWKTQALDFELYRTLENRILRGELKPSPGFPLFPPGLTPPGGLLPSARGVH